MLKDSHQNSCLIENPVVNKSTENHPSEGLVSMTSSSLVVDHSVKLILKQTAATKNLCNLDPVSSKNSINF